MKMAFCFCIFKIIDFEGGSLLPLEEEGKDASFKSHDSFLQRDKTLEGQWTDLQGCYSIREYFCSLLNLSLQVLMLLVYIKYEH